ncbi:MAG: hypothetical protein IJE10_03530 [Clostridia bacterium]|nr:hypothetical protein [Clostridia bacterium]
MLKKGLCLLLTICLLLPLIPTVAMANTANIRISTEGFPENWVNSNQSVKITADNSKNLVQSMTVNGETVSPVNGTPYYLLKQISFTDNTLTMGVFMGNHAANGGQFAFTYDTTKLQPATEVVNDFYIGATNITLIKKAPTDTRAGSGYLDTVKGNGYVTWVISTGSAVGGENTEVPLFTMSFALKDGTTLSDLNADTFGTPAISDLYKPSMNQAPCLTINGTTVTTDLKHAVWLNDTVYGDSIYPTFTFEGQTNGADPFEVVVTDKNGNAHPETIPVKVDLVSSLDAPTFDLSEDHTEITVSNVACATNAPSGITFKAELYVGGQKQAESAVQNGTATLTAPEGVTATVKVIATSGVGVTSSANKNIFVPVIDRIGPEITVSGLPQTEWSNSDVTFTVSASDPSGIRDIKVDDAPYLEAITATESKSYSIVATDNEGNSSQKQIEIKIDKTKPEANITVSDEWGKTNSITVNATDNQSDVKEIKVNGTLLTGTVYSATDNGSYTVEVTDNAGNTFTETVTVSKVDTTAPTIQIIVSEQWGQTNLITVNAIDTQSGVCSVEINGVAVDNLAVQQNGDYPVKVTDNAGNVYETVATVTKVDIDAPVVQIHKTEGWAKECVISVSATDSQSGVKEIKINGEVCETLTVTDNGSVAVEVTDNAGNTFTEAVNVDNVDTDLPEIQVDAFPTEDVKEFNMTFTATDARSGVASVMVNGNLVTGTEGMYSYFVNQNKDYEIVVTDRAGNVTNQRITVNILDVTAPTINVTGNPSNWTNEDVVLTVSAVDNGVCTLYFEGNLLTQNTVTITENGTYTVLAVDEAGNQTSETVVVSFMDKQPPELQAVVQQTWGKTNTITINATDSDSQVKDVKVNNALFNGSVYTATANGDVTVTVTDYAGNSTEQVVTVSKVDTEKPTVTVTDVNDTPCLAFTFEIEASDSQSGVKTVYVNGNPIQGNTFTATANGTYIFTAEDYAGNLSDSVEKVLNSVDSTLPEVTAVSGNPEAWLKGEAEITVSFSELCASVKVDGEAVATNASSATFTADSNKGYVVTFADVAGNANSYTVSVTYLDNNAPEFSVNVQETWGKTNLISVLATDAQSGVKEIKIGTTVANSLVVTQNGNVTVTVTDNAGNTATQTVEVTKVDTTVPVAEIDVQEAWGQTNSITVTATDTQSGVASVTVGGTPVTKVDDKYVYTASENGEYAVVVTDHAGNLYTETVNVEKVDTVLPELTVSDAPSQWCKEHTFTISVTDALSGIKEIMVNDTVLTENSYKVTQNGEYVFKATDNAGNSVSKTVQVEKIDTSVPVFDGEISVTALGETSFTLAFPIATDASSVTYAVKVNGEAKAYDGNGSFSLTGLSVNTEYTVELTATDAVGNHTTLSKIVKTAGLGKVKVVINLSELGTPTETLLMNATVNGVTKVVDNNGIALFEDLTAGEYIVKIEGAGYLVLEKKVTAENGKETVLTVKAGTDLQAGDINGDKKIDLKDFNIIGSYYGENAVTSVQKTADLNRDGKVDGKDVSLFLKGFRK